MYTVVNQQMTQQQTTTHDTELQDQITSALRKVKNQYTNDTLGLQALSSGDALLTLKKENHSSYEDKLQSRPSLEIGVAVAEALLRSDVDSDMVKVGVKTGSRSDAVKVVQRPFKQKLDRFQEVL
ncbi:hypothetical protein OSG_eHP23_00175 [environmental Halophage eHP-23]|nr:hypothetical protein OSG_eHP23_00175 [environmental Halophage eHP-23]